ncbi:MAG: hypothetical protein WCK76_14140, partial [Elusimicrobiota bacterium]
FREAWLEARQLGAPLALQFLVPNANTAGLGLKAADRKALGAGIKAVLAEEGRAAAAGTAGLGAALNFLEGGARPAACGAGLTFFMLSPEGRFYLCPFHKELTAPPAGAGGLRARLKGPGLRVCRGCFLRCAL